MSEFELYCRPLVNILPKIPLPVYVRSAGRKILDHSYRESVQRVRNNFFEIQWCVQGTGEIILYRETFPLSVNDIFCFRPREPHEIRATSSAWECYWLAFDGPYASAFWDSYNYPRLIHSCHPFPRDIFQDLFVTVSSSSPFIIRENFARLCQIMALASPEEPEPASQLIKNALQLMQQELSSTELNVNYLAKQLGVHRSTLSKHFQRQYNCDLVTYIRRLRMQYAIANLCDSDLSVQTIAIRCGIPELSTFSRCFRAEIGMSPLHFRQKHRES